MNMRFECIDILHKFTMQEIETIQETKPLTRYQRYRDSQLSAYHAYCARNADRMREEARERMRKHRAKKKEERENELNRISKQGVMYYPSNQ